MCESVVYHSLHSPMTVLYLKVIAATVASDPTKYSEAFLGKPNQEYCEWILNPEKWGGMSDL